MTMIFKWCWLWMGISLLGCATFGAVGPARPPQGSQTTRTDSADGLLLPDATEHYLKATLSLQDGKLKDAIEETRLAIRADPQSAFLHTSLGRLLAVLGRWDEVQTESHEALRLNPSDLDAMTLQGLAERRSDKADQAVATFQRVMEQDPTRIDAYLQLADIWLGRHDRKRALEILQLMAEKNPLSAIGFRQLGDAYFERGDEKKAEECFRKVLQLDPSDTVAIKTLTGLLEQQGRYREAIHVFVDALEMSPENPYYMGYMARLYLKEGDEKSAMAYFDQLRASDPTNASIIARVYTDLNLHRKAIHELQGVLKDNPDLHSERLLLGILWEERKEFEKAITELRQIPPNSRFYANAQTNLGYALRHMNRWEEAKAVLTAAFSLQQEEENLVRIHRILSEVYIGQQKYDEGLKVLDAALAKNPDLSELIEAKANLLQDAGRGKEGVELLKGAVENQPDNVALLYSLGALYERQGQIEQSVQTMRRVLDQSPNNYSALNFIGYTLADQGQDKDLEEAERLIRRALLLDPGNGAIIDSLGWILYRQGKYEKALDYLQRADQISPGEAVIIMHVGDALSKLGKKDEAVQHYRRALSSRPDERTVKELQQKLKQLGAKP